MNIQNGSKRWIFFSVSAFVCFLLVSSPQMHAGDSAIGSVLESSKALVDILSVNATVVSGKPQGFIDKATGQIFITQKMRPVGYTRNGSGIIIDPRGIIVTNAHLVQGAGSLIVTLYDGARVPVKEAQIVADSDLAFLSIDPPLALTALRFADSDAVRPGVNVYTVGHSEWLKGTMLGGRIAGIQRNGASHVTALMINFDMNRGDSGCPVLDAKGELLGIVGAGLVGGGRATFAIPSNAIATAYRDYSEKSGK